MLKHFSQTLRTMLEQSQLEARQLNQEFVGTEHLALGILHGDDCEAGRVLQKNHLPAENLRGVLLRALPKGEQPPAITGALPLSPKAQRTVQNALVRAQSLQQPRVTTRLMLLALLDEPQTLLRDVLHQKGADIDQLLRHLAEQPEFQEN